jgi:hypothetical protein
MSQMSHMSTELKIGLVHIKHHAILVRHAIKYEMSDCEMDKDQEFCQIYHLEKIISSVDSLLGGKQHDIWHPTPLGRVW